MKDVFTQLNSQFNATAALVAHFEGGLYLGVAPDNNPLPTCTVNTISNLALWTTCDSISEQLLQFSVFAETAEDCLDGIDLIKTKFDNISLALTPVTSHILMRHTSILAPIRVDQRIWRGTIDFELIRD